KGPSRRRGNIAIRCIPPRVSVASMKGPSRRRGNQMIRVEPIALLRASMKGPSRRRGNLAFVYENPFFNRPQ
ncbi:hypothetical protein, partial [Propionibacterium freudenreichii]|uniref:hypothetical protein n=1 Tax=Propionibacterium freudenreichii TaxID=1744 RepID=UPI0039B6F6C3